MRGNLIMVCFGGWEEITIPRRRRMDRNAAFRLSVCLPSCRLVCLFWLFPSRCPSADWLSLPAWGQKERGCPPSPPPLSLRPTLTLFWPSIFHSWGDILSAIFPAPSHSPSWPRAIRGERPAPRDDSVREVGFIGPFVDGWGKIEPRQMGEDSRQTARRKDWSLGFGAKMRFFFFFYLPESETLEVLAQKFFFFNLCPNWR